MQRYSYEQLSEAEKEKVRLAACEEVRKEKKRRKYVADKYNMSLGSLKKWLSLYDQHGEDGVLRRPKGRPPGSGRKLSAKKFENIKKIIETQTPEQHKLPFFLWCREAVVELIYKRYKVKYALTTMSQILQELGLTLQKPIMRYREQKDEAVQTWLHDDYPQLVKKVKAEGGEIHWCDETCVQNTSNVQKSYAPKGKTPVFEKTGKRLKCSVISSVTNLGRLRFMAFDGALKAETMIEFMRRLIRGTERKIYLVVDNLAVHKSKKVKGWEQAHIERIELIYLPSYSPDLNPNELVNNCLKKIVFKEKRASTLHEIKSLTRRALKKLQNYEDKMRKLFDHPSVSYARAAA